MKTRYLIIIILTLLGISVVGQTSSTVETPWGTTVNVWTPQNDMTLKQRDDMDDSVATQYPNADFLPTLPNGNPTDPSSSSMFNCHGYAWFMYHEEDEFDAPWNMHSNDAEKYFEDPSFAECTESEADILWINNGAHSALTTDDPDELLSKWATGPLAIHGKGSSDSPWPPTSSNTTYYKKCLEKISTTYYSDISLVYCAINFKNTVVSSNVDLEAEYEKVIKIEGTFSTGTGATLYFHPE